MSSFFSADAPYRSYVTKLRWLIGGLAGAVFLLMVGLLLTLSGGDPDATPEAVAVAPQPETVGVLIAKERIEAGERLSNYLFETKPVLKELVPPGVLKADPNRHLDGMYAVNMITARSFVSSQDVTREIPTSTFHIPSGYRATSITVNARSGVEGYARPNSRVDVLWVHQDDRGRRRVSTIVRFAKVLSFNGVTSAPDGYQSSGLMEGARKDAATVT